MEKSAHYKEEIFFTEGDAGDLLEQNQKAITDVLSKNQAVGVIGGFYEEGSPIYFISQFMLDNLGYTYEEFMQVTGGRYTEIVYVKDYDAFVRNNDSEEHLTREYRVVNKQGESIWVSEIRKDSVTVDNRKMWISAVRVIDDVHRRETELLEALSSEYESIIYVDLRRGTYEWVKRKQIMVDEYRNGTIQDLRNEVKRYLRDYVHPEDAEIRKILNMVFDNPSVMMEEGYYLSTYRRLNRNRYEWMQMQAIFGGNMKIDTGYVVLAFRNADKRIRKELDTNRLLSDSLENAKKANLSKREFLSKMSHDMRTPLNTILGVLELVKSSDDINQIKEDYLKSISFAGKHLLSLVDEILDMSEIESGNMVIHDMDFDLCEFAEKLKVFMGPELAEKNQRIELDVSGVCRTQVVGDQNALEKIFINLLSNASKYSENGADIHFCIREMPRLRTGYAHYCFSVQDQGIGIAEDKLEVIFEPFERVEDTRTSKVPYIGLGLAITKSLVEMLKGDIAVTSTPGQGSCFTVTVELKVREDERIETKPDTGISGIRALLVEDNAINRKILKKLLEAENVIVEEAVNGQEAVSAFAVKEKGYYDVILMDIQMPIMNGYGATRQIRAMVNHGGDEVPIIAVTADAFKEDVQLALQAGMDGHLKKPVNFEDLKVMLAKYR